MKRSLLFIALIVLVAGLAWQLGKPGAADGKQGATGAVMVILATATVQDVPLRLEITGRTEAFETVTLKARVDGQVKSVLFAQGQHVKQGEILLQLDPADYQAKLNQAAANLAKSQAQAVKAKADAERYAGLKARGFVSEEKVAEVRANAAATESTAQADAAAAEMARLQLSYTRVVAPFAGIVGARLVSPGTAVRANDTTLAVVNKVQPLYVSFAAPEKYLPQIQAGMRSSKRGMKAGIAVPGAPGAVDGDVSFIDNGVDVTTGTIQLKAVIKNGNESLAPGQFVNVSLVLDVLKAAVTVPAEAVQQGSEGSFLFVVKDGAAEIRKAKIATVQKGLAVIAEGLSEGETVVTEGQLRLTPGAKVKTVESTDAAKGKQP